MGELHARVRCVIPNALDACVNGIIPRELFPRVYGIVSRGVKQAEIDENGHLIFTMTDNTVVDLGRVKGDPGATTWDGIENKPFERLGDTLKVEDGTLDVNIYETGNPQGGNTLYIGG